MAKRRSGSPHSGESDLLKRLREAVRASGLTAELSALSSDERSLVVTNRLAQTSVRHLSNRVDAAAGQMLVEELRALGSPAEFELLMADRGFAYFHVIQFIYEFAKTYADVPDRELFCLSMGRGGGGIEVEPNLEVVSLVRLLICALSAEDDRRHLGELMRDLGPMILSQIFPVDLFRIDIEPDGEDRLRVALRYTDRAAIKRLLDRRGLGDDLGSFFLNSALHIQGSLELGWEIFAENSRRDISMRIPVEERDSKAVQAIVDTCVCSWAASWRADVRLNRIRDDDGVTALARTVYEALSRKDLEYYLERIKSLEIQVQKLSSGKHHGGLIGESDSMREVFETIERVAPSDLTVLIRGDSGTGKELVARAIHDKSPRSGKPFVAVNCAAFSDTLLESELFGHERGAFTGADREKPGRFELAHGGTLFLDEVGDLPLTTQVKLLRVMETRSFERVGGTRTIQTDVRILGATNQNLEDLIARGEFREDLFFRLHVLLVQLPSLTERRDDIPLLAQHFLERAVSRSDKNVRGFSRGAMDQLLNYRWPGNVRELQNAVERAVIVYSRGETLTDADIRRALGIRGGPVRTPSLNLRQRDVLSAVQGGGTTLNTLLQMVGPKARSDGRSKRTLQNDLRRLLELEYLTFYKEGSIRHYQMTEGGTEVMKAAGG